MRRLPVVLLCATALAEVCAADPPLLGEVPPLAERTIMRWEMPDEVLKETAHEAGVEQFQLFLPSGWRRTDAAKWPLLIFLHGAGDGIWSVMNSQSLPRLLSSDQSTAFDARKTWAFDFGGAHYENATFARDFPFVVVMPQGWDGTTRGGWSRGRLDRVEALAEAVAGAYGVDRARVSLTGQSAGGVGAWAFGMRHPDFLSALVPVCGAVPGKPREAAERLKDLPVWVFHAADDIAMPVHLADGAVRALGSVPRPAGPVKFTRYDHGPPPPDPQYNDMIGHASYDLAYRDAALYAWLLAQVRAS